MNLDLWENEKLECFSHGGNRYYILPKSDIAVPSVTSVIYKDNTFEDTPKSLQARDRGTDFHTICENYVTSGKLPTNDPFGLASFMETKEEMDKSLSDVNLIEGTLYSKVLMSAGRCDMVGVWDNELSVIDFKRVGYPKKPEWLDDYWLQLSAYGLMVEELYSAPVKQLVLITQTTHDGCQIFKNEIQFNKLVETFRDKRGLGGYPAL